MIGRRWLWRLSRSAYYTARRDLMRNQIASNGEASLQRRVAARHASRDAANDFTAIDVGANVGEWTLAMLETARGAGVAATVHAFEPVPAVHEELCKRISADADASRVSCVAACVGSEVGTAQMQLSEGLAGSHSLVRKTEGGEVVDVPVTTIEAYCADRGVESIDLLKIDAEGVDFEVILGALPLLRAGRIEVLQFEYNSCWIDARRFLKDVFELADSVGLCVGKLVGEGIELYPAWHPELERFIEGNFALGRRETLEAVGGVMGSGFTLTAGGCRTASMSEERSTTW